MSYDFSELQQHIRETDQWLRKEYTQFSTGRANPNLLDSVLVEAYGSKQPIKNLATVTIEDARTLRITPWDSSSIKAVQGAIEDAKLPASVAVDDKGVRVIVPQLTEETRKELVKLLKKKHEEARVSLRKQRQETEKEIDAGEAAGDYAEDEKFRLKEELQKQIDAANKQLDDVLAQKEKDVMTVS